jgi:hypothetical protein
MNPLGILDLIVETVAYTQPGANVLDSVAFGSCTAFDDQTLIQMLTSDTPYRVSAQGDFWVTPEDPVADRLGVAPATIFTYSSVDELASAIVGLPRNLNALVLFTHGLFNDNTNTGKIAVADRWVSLTDVADAVGTAINNQGGGTNPAIKALLIDGCRTGRDTDGLKALGQRIGATTVFGWTDYVCWQEFTVAQASSQADLLKQQLSGSRYKVADLFPYICPPRTKATLFQLVQSGVTNFNAMWLNPTEKNDIVAATKTRQNGGVVALHP